MVPGSGIAIVSPPSIPSKVSQCPVVSEENVSTPKQARGSRKRSLSRPKTPPLPTSLKRTRTLNNEGGIPPSNTKKQKEIIYIPDSDSDFEDDEPVHTRSVFQRQVLTVVDSDSDSDSHDSIRSVSPPVITLPTTRSFIRRSLSPLDRLITNPVRLAFQKPIDDTPTDSDSDSDSGQDEHGSSNPVKDRTNDCRGRDQFPALDTYDMISITSNDMLVGMFTDHNLKPQQAWRFGIPTPPDSRASGSASPIKRGEGWGRVSPPGPESDGYQNGGDMGVEAVSRHQDGVGGRLGDIEAASDSREDMDMDVDTCSETDDRIIQVDDDRPATPPLPCTPATTHQLSIESPSIDNPSRISISESIPRLVDARPLTPPLPDRDVGDQHFSGPVEAEDISQLRITTERDIASRPSKSPTTDHDKSQDDAQTAHLTDWTALYAEIAPSAFHGKAKQEESNDTPQPLALDPQAQRPRAADIVTSLATSQKAKNPGRDAASHAISLQSKRPSTIPPPSTTDSHLEAPTTAAEQFTSSILDLLIVQSHSQPRVLIGHSIALAPPIPFQRKLVKLIEVLGGKVLDQSQAGAIEGERYLVHSTGYQRDTLKGVEHLDVLGFLEVLREKIGASS